MLLGWYDDDDDDDDDDNDDTDDEEVGMDNLSVFAERILHGKRSTAATTQPII
jgi:hypothetical protein